MSTFKFRKQILLAQMLPHTWIGHPVASILTALGCDKAADNFHYFTIPARAKRKVKQSEVPWIADSRLRVWDMIIVPIYSLLDAFGRFDTAAAVCRMGPWQACMELGACYSVRFEGKVCKYCGEEIGDALGGLRGKHQSLTCYKSPTGKHELK